MPRTHGFHPLYIGAAVMTWVDPPQPPQVVGFHPLYIGAAVMTHAGKETTMKLIKFPSPLHRGGGDDVRISSRPVYDDAFPSPLHRGGGDDPARSAPCGLPPGFPSPLHRGGG